MRNFLSLFIFLATTIGYSQQLSCEDFKTGEFFIEVSSPLKMEWEIVRNGNEQVEIYDKISQEFKDQGFPSGPLYLRIDWIDDCNYRMFFDESKGIPTEVDKKMTEAGGLLVEMVKIEGDCFYYASSINVDGENYITEGKICRK
ncbi:MAG: hypothetical protein ABJM06_14915 [Gilvibacter sp.]